MNKCRKFYLIQILLCLMIPMCAFGEVLEPTPNGDLEHAFDRIIYSGSFGDLRMLILSLVSGVMLVFSAWALYGVFEAHFVEKQISLKAAVFLFIRLLAMLTITIILINL